MVGKNSSLDLSGLRILMLAPCLGKFGGIETFCLTLAEDLLSRGASVRLLRKKVSGYSNDGSIESSEEEIRKSWKTQEDHRFSTDYVDGGKLLAGTSFDECDLVHLHNPMVEGVWLAKRRNLPCVMTVYNWRRRGLHPRLLAWRWAVRSADRRWYISEFVWDTWERTRRKGSARLPVVSRMPSGETEPSKRRGFLFLGRWIPNKGLRVLIKAYSELAPDPEAWPLTVLGDGPLRSEVEEMISQGNAQGVQLMGFVSEEEAEPDPMLKMDGDATSYQGGLGIDPAQRVSWRTLHRRMGRKETGGVHALVCEPGNEDSLLDCMKRAMEMKGSQYEK